MALLLDNKFTDARQLLQALSGSRALARGDLEGFLLELHAVAEAGDAEAVSLAAPDGQVLLSTLWPSPTPPKKVIGTRHALDALASGRWSISNLFLSPTTKRHAISVVFPFDLDAPGLTGRHLVAFILKRDHLLTALVDQRLPPGSVASILDRDKVMVARTLRDQETVGMAAGSRLGQQTAEEGVISLTTWEGIPVVSAYARAPLSGYWVRVHVPESVFSAPLRAALLRAAAIGTGMLATSLALALLLARWFAASLRYLAPGDGARVLREMESGWRPGSGLREVDELAAALDRASAQRDSALAELRLLHASSPVGMARTDTGGRIQAANDAFLRLVGLSATDLGAGAVRWDNLTPPEWHARDEAAIAEAIDWGYCSPYEKEFLRPDGERVPVLVAFGLLDRSTGKCATFAVDLSDRKRAEAALAESQDRLALAQEAGGIGLWDLDTASGELATTPTWRALHGLSAEGLVERFTLDSWLASIVEADRARVAGEFRAVAAGAPCAASSVSCAPATGWSAGSRRRRATWRTAVPDT
ncbi:PAS domain S-box protein [Dankookia sp. P2]|uniref:PAS domain S-box protein n=1 Tax=Dankookia sp. P2 TaxID=3423955 RepID=UPI003D672F71